MSTHDHRDRPATSEQPAIDQDCGDAVERLYEYLDGELDTATVTRIEVHLKRCSPCLETYDFHAELRQVIRSKCAESMPQDVRIRLLGMFAGPPS